jgi:hypothetical protein
MKLPRRTFLHLAAGAAALPALSQIARAQAYPSRPVRLIVPAPAGGGYDLTARLISQVLSEREDQIRRRVQDGSGYARPTPRTDRTGLENREPTAARPWPQRSVLHAFAAGRCGKNNEGAWQVSALILTRAHAQTRGRGGGAIRQVIVGGA